MSATKVGCWSVLRSFEMAATISTTPTKAWKGPKSHTNPSNLTGSAHAKAEAIPIHPKVADAIFNQ